jgi:glycosyltransferase involved in cell wall biosynthesis
MISVKQSIDGQHRKIAVMFAVTSLTYGGAETLLLNLIRRIDRSRFSPELCCIKQRGHLGEELSNEIATFAYGLKSKYDVRVLPWMTRLLRSRRTDALVTVGAGDKMFWGRLAAQRVGVPVIISALHTTGWPDKVNRLNRWLTPLNDAFVGVAPTHARHLIENECFPEDKVHVIPNGVDAQRFTLRARDRTLTRKLGIPDAAPVVGIVARLDPVKNHEMFLEVARQVRAEEPATHFLVVGDGPRREGLERLADALGLQDCVHFLGSRADVPELLSLMNVFTLTSYIEANPVSILEAFSSGVPVVATRVGSVPDTVADEANGYLVEAGDVAGMSARIVRLIRSPHEAEAMGNYGRQQVVEQWSLEQMVLGYEQLIQNLYHLKCHA